MDYKIIADSCCDLPLEFIKNNDIEIINLMINMDGKDYLDDMGETFDRNAFFEALKNGARATSSQVNIGTFLEVFKKYVEIGQPVLFLGLSSALSGSYNNAVTAVEMLKEEYDQVNITIVDSKAACLGEGLLVYEAVNRKKEGQSLEEVVDWLEEYKMKLHSWVTVDDIRHLERSGRISSVSATLGSVLNVKPIIVMNEKGGLVPSAKVRGRKKSLHYLINKTVEGMVDPENQTIFIGHVGVPEEAEWIKKEIESKIKVKDVQIYPYGPTIAAHTGFGSVALFSFGNVRK
ncbi:DegV family protein [Carnobacterium viridans]|uniref:EDD domain protein, DegV family n=1 Tax=Carnobacterium viridans TaxID=174587 RepID=A0A1H0XS23_9LACT|nr:DegV family protein [Carnobacterium viridans]SDQ05690.1 EDD domain protein, DegV family [Carnobacterium viridans]